MINLYLIYPLSLMDIHIKTSVRVDEFLVEKLIDASIVMTKM